MTYDELEYILLIMKVQTVSITALVLINISFVQNISVLVVVGTCIFMGLLNIMKNFRIIKILSDVSQGGSQYEKKLHCLMKQQSGK